MASKRPRGLDLGLDADAGSGPSTRTASPTPVKKKKLYCHFKTLWKTQEFSVKLNGGATKSICGDVLSGVEGGDSAKC